MYLRDINKGSKDVVKPLCELYCGYRKMYVKDLRGNPCDECMKKEIESGLLYCSKCGRWYPIEDDIPRMLPDDLRNRDEDIEGYLEVFPEELEKLKQKRDILILIE